MKQISVMPTWQNLSASVVTLLLITACGGGDSGGDTSPDTSGETAGKLQRVTSETELLGHIRSALLERYGTVNNNPYPEVYAEAADSSAGGASAAVSTTNVQESGVDEADRIKSDGKYLYVSSRNEPALLVYETDASTSVSVANFDLETEGNNPLQGLYLQGDRLTAVAQNSGYYGYPVEPFALATASSSLPYGYQSNPATQLFMLDVSQPTQPQQRVELSVDGSLISSRMIGSRLYLATRHTAAVPELIAYPTDDNTAAANREKINQADLDDLLGSYRINGVDQGNLFDASDCFVSPYTDNASMNIISLISVDVSSDNPQPQGQCFVGDAETLYASTSAIYLATTQYPMYTLGLMDDAIAVDAEASALSADSIKTDLHKFSLSSDAIAYKGSGQVKGHLGWQQDLKPFRMSEYNDVLRVITYIGDNQDGATASLYTLKENAQDQSLEIIAQLPNTSRPAPLGKPGEQIYATRFQGERGYLVTFRMTDPLYILDLSDPADPFIISELEIEGYSDYLHPVGENFLLGIGKDAIADTRSAIGDGRGAWYQGVKLSLIDITNPSQPYEKQKILLGKRGSNTAVSNTHHALTSLQKGNNLQVALPLSRHENLNQYNGGPSTSEPSYYYGWTNDELVGLDIDSVNGVMTQSSSIISSSNVGNNNYSSGWTDDRSVMIGDAIHYLHGDKVISREW